jgi:hypothetical protein
MNGLCSKYYSSGISLKLNDETSEALYEKCTINLNTAIEKKH